MKIKRWRCFWKWFLSVALAVYVGCSIFLYAASKIYQSSALLETAELFPGENPQVPEAVAARCIQGRSRSERLHRPMVPIAPDADPIAANIKQALEGV